ncbi:putative bromodomain-containing protein 10 isoform 1-T4 [Spinachia spinachia]
MDQLDVTDQIAPACNQRPFQDRDLIGTDHNPPPQRPSANMMSSQSKWGNSGTEDTDHILTYDGLTNGTCEVETMVALYCPVNSGNITAEGDRLALSNEGMSELPNSDLSLPEVCISTNSNSFEDDMNYEVQQAYRIFKGFLSDKHKGITSPFLHPICHQEAQHGIGGVCGLGQAQLMQSMCLRRMEEKFMNQQYDSITEFVADFRLMLENSYRYHGVDHWTSKQAQKLEIMLEQKLTLLSRTLREKTTLTVTSKGRFGAEEERGSGGTSTRRRLAPRSLTTITVGGHESIMVQALRLEEQQRTKEEKRQRELEKKEAEEMSAKEVEEWEQTLLSQASPHTVDTLWELPAIGHFLCLAQTSLNLPEIVFFDLERCLLMPRCSLLLSKIMSSLLSPSQRRATLHRRPVLLYRRWESELRQRVMGWYRAVGAAHDQPGRAEQLGLCHQFFRTLGEASPLEEKPFHLLPFYQRVWLLKGLCDHVYQTQKYVQDALLAQPIHECRESILGYDGTENCYIHFPHFCGADLRIYCQSPGSPPVFPFPSVWAKRVDKEPGTEGEGAESDGTKAEGVRSARRCRKVSTDTERTDDFGTVSAETLVGLKGEKMEVEESWSLKKEEESESGSSDGDLCEKRHTNSSSCTSHVRGSDVEMNLKGETVESEHQSKRLPLKRDKGFSLSSMRTIKAETQEPCLSVGEHSYTGRSPARLVNLASPHKLVQMEGGSPSQPNQRCPGLDCCKSKNVEVRESCGGTSGQATMLSSESSENSSEEGLNDKICPPPKKRKKKLEREKGKGNPLHHVEEIRSSSAETTKSAVQRVTRTLKRKDKKKNHKTGRNLESSKAMKDDETSVEPSFKLVCTSLEDLRKLINKTEDELNELESIKKRLGRWYYRKEAVKDLHSTLIRLLNELSPWEPKLVKAYQRNRLRLKKEYDDFKKQPEYNNFVREESISSSSSSDVEDEEKGLRREVYSFPDHYERSAEEDMEHMVPRGLWRGGVTTEFVAGESAGERTVNCEAENHIKPPLGSPEKHRSNITSNSDEGRPSNQLKDLDLAWATKVTAQAPVSPRSPILHPTTGLPKGYTPIPTLLAKSVGNKVTLMKRPADYTDINIIDRRSKGSSVSPPTSTKLSKAQNSSSSLEQNSQQTQALGQRQQTEVLRQPGVTTGTAARPKSLQAKTTKTVTNNLVQMVYKVPEGLSHLIRKNNNNNSSPVKFSVHPVVDQNTGEKIMQQLVILPSNLLVHKVEENGPRVHQQSKVPPLPVSKVASPFSVSTNVPGFTISENGIPVQQVAPLTGARTVRETSPLVSPRLQHGALKGPQACIPQAGTPQGVTAKPPPITALPCAVSAEPKQELRTVCIRDSQSILVTTRGGNTAIVKVQTSSDQNANGSSAASPVITISPQLKAFLVSKTSQTVSPPASSQASPYNFPAVTGVPVAQPQPPSLLKSPSSLTTPMLAAVTGPGGRAAGTTGATSRVSTTSVVSTDATNVGQLAHAAGSHFQASLGKNTVAPSLSNFSVPKRASAEERSQVTKFFLVTPSASSASNVALSKRTPSHTKSPPSSRVMLFSQPPATSSTTCVGSTPKQATSVSAQLLASSLSSQTLKMGFSPDQAVVRSEAASKVKNIPLSSGAQIQLLGTTTTIGQTIGALSRSPSKSTPVSASNTAAATGLVPLTSSNTITSSSAQLASNSSLITSCQLKGVSTFSTISRRSSSTFAASAPMRAGNVINKDLCTASSILSSSSPAQGTTTVQSSPAQTSTLVHHPSNIQSGTRGETPSFSSPSQLAPSKAHPAISPATTNIPITTSAPGTIQQRIVINTSTPLAAGTQIVLHNARFVVPPQGLAPGSHVLIISSPAPQQVPIASAGASVPPRGSSHVTVAPQALVLPQSPVRTPGVPVMSSPFVACTPAVGPSLLATTPSVTPVGHSGAQGLCSTWSPSKTNVVSALPRLPAAQADNFASPPSATPTAVSSPPRLSSSAPALDPPAATCAPTLCAAAPAECSPAILPAAASPSSRSSAPPSPALSSPLAVTPPGAVVPPLSLSHQKAPSVQKLAATQSVLASALTQVVPTVAVPTIVSAMSRMQTLPVATVPPIGSTFSTFETAPSSSSSVAITSAQTIAPPETNDATFVNRAAGKQCPQNSFPRGHSDAASKLLVGSDGAVLNAVQCRVNPAAWPKPLDALIVFPNSPSAALHENDSTLQPSPADRTCTK